MLARVRNAEYKRRQAPPTIKITRKAFGLGWKMPIVISSGRSQFAAVREPFCIPRIKWYNRCFIIGTLIYFTDILIAVIKMSMVCKLLGHKFQETIVINREGDFYEVEDARYCRQCGSIHPDHSAS